MAQLGCPQRRVGSQLAPLGGSGSEREGLGAAAYLAANLADGDHVMVAVRQSLGPSGMAGFFAAGEIGPVAARNHLHAFTASMLAFESGGG